MIRLKDLIAEVSGTKKYGISRKGVPADLLPFKGGVAEAESIYNEPADIKKRLGGRYGGEPEFAVADPGNKEPALSAKKEEVNEAIPHRGEKGRWKKAERFARGQKNLRMSHFLTQYLSALSPWTARTALPNPGDHDLVGADARKAYGLAKQMRKILGEAINEVTLADMSKGSAKGKQARVHVGFFHNGRSVNIGKTGTVLDIARKFGGKWGAGGMQAAKIKFDDVPGLNRAVWVQASLFVLNEAVADAKDDVTPEDSHEIEKDLATQPELDFATNSPKMFEDRDADEAQFSPTNFSTPQLKDLVYDVIDEAGAVGEVQKKLMRVLHGVGFGDHQLADLARNPEFRAVHFGRIQRAAAALKKKKLINYDGTSKVSLVEVSDTPIDTYKGWPIFTLSPYSTPYYYPQQRWVKGRKVGGSMEHHMRIKRVEKLIDKWLKQMGKETLDEGETWGKDHPAPGKLSAKKQQPKAVPEELGDFEDSDVQGVVNDEPLKLKDMVPEAKKVPSTKWHTAVVYVKRLRAKGKRREAEYANAYLNWAGRGDRLGRAKNVPEPEAAGLSAGAARNIKRDMEAILKKEIHWLDPDEVDRLFKTQKSPRRGRGTSAEPSVGTPMSKIRKAPASGWRYEK